MKHTKFSQEQIMNLFETIAIYSANEERGRVILVQHKLRGRIVYHLQQEQSGEWIGHRMKYKKSGLPIWAENNMKRIPKRLTAMIYMAVFPNV